MSDPCRFRPIGVIRTDASEEEVKSSYEGVRGYVEVFSEFSEGLKGVEGFSHLILITCLHRVSEEQRKVLVVRPRRLMRFGLSLEELPEVGVFASDSPHRPNPIGLHVVRLEGIEGHRLLVSGLDAFDGTPVLDIKPYTISRLVERPSYPEWYEELRRRTGREV
ncbi:MAG: tRNA (N6-threonylcarbamoyladenosine(37)-N6)-methyltransferase TrmO [Candidatus Korarchaeota archaeon]|nr:tRNA (N6-threonylcarbamoyladenosine(37)-N6)-methyltransferase TrmO [Candidatus Korarchaeota archaeon]